MLDGVAIVIVEVWFDPLLVREAGLKEKNPPTGGGGQAGEPVGAALKSTVQETVVLPLKATVIP